MHDILPVLHSSLTINSFTSCVHKKGQNGPFAKLVLLKIGLVNELSVLSLGLTYEDDEILIMKTCPTFLPNLKPFGTCLNQKLGQEALSV